MTVDWELREAGPTDAEHTVLLLPGGSAAAGSYAELMAEPKLAGMRLVAATLPGNAGAPPPDDYSMENYARLTSELAREVGADVVVGFSNGGNVAIEMIVSGLFEGPAVLLGVSLSTKDEPAVFRALVRLGGAERQEELREDFRKNVPGDLMPGLREYMRWLHRGEGRAERLCETGVPTWIVHAEKGDGDLTDDERRTLEACPGAHLVTIPGSVLFLPNEVPGQVAEIIAEAAAQTG
jgi:pimeloyl-ACP methyl ester carboxylesterase